MSRSHDPPPPVPPPGNGGEGLEPRPRTPPDRMDAWGGITARGPAPVVERRVPRWLLGALVVLVLALAGVGYLAYRNYETGIMWHAEHDEVQQALDASEERATSLNEKLDESEADVVQLERRISSLADEKARAEDRRNDMSLRAAAWRELSDRVSANAVGMDGCIDLMTQLINLQISSWNTDQLGGYVDTHGLNRLTDEVFAHCGQVRDEARALRQFVRELS